MAATLARPGVIDLLEEAVHALRAAPLGTLATHWAGSVPFALGLLVFWNDMTYPGTPESVCAIESLALALLLAWMNAWRAVFAGRVARQLCRRPEPRWTWRRLCRLAASQTVLGGTKLALLPLAACVTLPLAWTVEFYRYAAVLADREELELPQVIAKARKLASLEQRQGWGILLILTALYLVLALNLAIVLAILPQLVRILTGYESAFSRSGTYFVSNSLFWLAALAAAWLLFDPFAQAVYCVRCFKLESRETGEDLRAALRVVTLLIAALPLWAAPALLPAGISPAKLDQSIQQALQSPEYSWRAAGEPKHAAGVPWLVAVTDRLADNAKAALERVGDAIDRFLEWLRTKLGSPSRVAPGAPPSAALHWSIYLLIAALLAFAAVFAWRMRRARSTRPERAAAAVGAPVNLEDDKLLADQLPEEHWMALAEDCARRQDFRSALRATYLASLAWLGRGRWIGMHPGKTNREYELEVRRKTRAWPPAGSLFALNVVSFERAWYGRHEVTAEDMARFRERFQQMKAMMAQRELAV